jgi:hypothetical protein
VFANTPTRVQNYGRLPVSDVVIEIDLIRHSGRTVVYLVPVGLLPPCREVKVEDQNSLYTTGVLKDVDKVRLKVHYVDPAGYHWLRGTSGLPEIDRQGVPRSDQNTNGQIVRSELTEMKYCAPP